MVSWILKTIWDAIRDLQKADTTLVDKVQKIEVLVAGDYVRNEKFDDTIKAMFAKLDRIEDKLNSKADRQGQAQ